MLNVIDLLCSFLGCRPHELYKLLERHTVRHECSEYLLQQRLYTRYKHGPNTCHIKYVGITLGSSRTVKAFQGYKGITVEQHFFSKYGIDLFYPKLTCVKIPRGDYDFNYIPIELVFVDRAVDDSRLSD